jgi:catechol 2,3-dioxygenase-like lactoylglutathione lyase family enzyme
MTWAKGVHHAAINVSDWDQSLTFYRDVLGFDFLLEGEAEGPGIEANTKLSGVRLRFAMLQAGKDHIELIQYESPAGRPNDRHLNDTASTHIAFQVDDIDNAFAELTERGVVFNDQPIKIDSGPLAGCAFAYFPDPDGVLLEIFQVAQTGESAPPVDRNAR